MPATARATLPSTRTFRVRLPPTLDRYHDQDGTVTDGGVDWLNARWDATVNVHADPFAGFPIIASPHRADVMVEWRVKRPHDAQLDARLPVLLDGLLGIAIESRKQIRHVGTSTGPSLAHGEWQGAVVTVRPVSDTPSIKPAISRPARRLAARRENSRPSVVSLMVAVTV